MALIVFVALFVDAHGAEYSLVFFGAFAVILVIYLLGAPGINRLSREKQALRDAQNEAQGRIRMAKLAPLVEELSRRRDKENFERLFEFLFREDRDDVCQAAIDGMGDPSKGGAPALHALLDYLQSTTELPLPGGARVTIIQNGRIYDQTPSDQNPEVMIRRGMALLAAQKLRQIGDPSVASPEKKADTGDNLL